MTSRRWRFLPDPLVQVVLIGICILLYFGVRGLTEGTVEAAIAHANRLMDVERTIGMDVEHGLQRPVIANPMLLNVANWIYIWGHWPVIAACAVWLYRRRHASYIRLRDAFFISGAIGLIIFASYPVAPPRLAGLGFIDTVTQHSHAYRVLQPPHLVNRYAALPSLHAGWNLVLGVAMFRATRNRAVRTVATVLPAAMAWAVVATANHFVIDAVAGVSLALFGWWAAARWPLNWFIGDRANGVECPEQVEAIADEPAHSPALQLACAGEVVHPPGEDHLGTTTQRGDDVGGEQFTVDRHAIQISRPVAPQEPRQLRTAPRGGQDAEPVAAPEPFQVLPAARADPCRTHSTLDRSGDLTAEACRRALQVDEQRCGGCSKQVLERKDRGRRPPQFPSIPVQRERPDGLEVAGLQTGAEQVDVDLDQVRAGRLGLAQRRQVVARPMCDRHRIHAVDRTDRRGPTLPLQPCTRYLSAREMVPFSTSLRRGVGAPRSGPRSSSPESGVRSRRTL